MVLYPPSPVVDPTALTFWLAQRAAALYCVYCLWQTQLQAPRVRAHLPLQLLHQLEAHAVPALVQHGVQDAVQALKVGLCFVLCVCVCVCVCVCMRVCACMHMCTCIRAYVRVRVRMIVCMGTCVRACFVSRL